MKLAVALGIVYVVWGSTYLAIAVANRTLPPLLMLSVRFLIAGALLYGWALRRGEAAAGQPGRRQWGAAAVVGGLPPRGRHGRRRLGRAAGRLRVSRRSSSRASRSSWRSSTAPSSAIAPAARRRRRHRDGPPRRRDPRRAERARRPARRGRPPRRVVRLGGGLGLRARGAAAAQPAALGRDADADCAGVVLAVVGLAMGEARARASRPRSRRRRSPRSRSSIVFGSLVAFTAYGWLLKNASTPLLSTYAYVNPARRRVPRLGVRRRARRRRSSPPASSILSSVALLALARERARRAEPTAESLAPYIRRAGRPGRRVPRVVPRLAELRRIAAVARGCALR